MFKKWEASLIRFHRKTKLDKTLNNPCQRYVMQLKTITGMLEETAVA